MMKRPTEAIEMIREAVNSGNIEPDHEYRLRIGDGEVHSFTGAQLLETGNAVLAYADAEERGDKAAMMAAMDRFLKLA